MITLSSVGTRGGAFLVGVGLHVFLFRRGEWDLQAARFVATFVVVQVAGVAAVMKFMPENYDTTSQAIADVSILAIAVVLGIYSSMLIYRAFFHRLNRFPGPFWARLSNFYPTWLSAKRLQRNKEVQALHKQYGDFVRLGPSELSVTDPSAIQALHSVQSPCTKGPWYNVMHPMVSLEHERNRQVHTRRRKVWDRGFSTKALRDYEPRVVRYADQLLVQLERLAGEPVDVTKWFNFYSFDVMGDLAWGKSFNMVQNGVKHYFMTALHQFMTNVGYFSHLIWLLPIFKATPILNRSEKRFWRWVNEQVSERRKMKPDRPDVFSWLLAEHESGSKPTAQEELNLIGDAYLIAVAGSDTTAATLTCLFFELAQAPDKLITLQKEIDEAFAESEDLDSLALSKLSYLDAVINEGLRLHPPVPSGVQRMTPPEGLQIGETFVPGESIVQMPSYSMFRDPRFFEQPDSFIPERWTTKKELTKNSSVFLPFSTGRYSCIGKQLGLMEARHVTAQIVRKYNVRLAPNQSPGAFLDEKKDTFTSTLGPLYLILDPRKQ